MNTMRPTASALSRLLPALLVAGVVSIVLGIVGMHALNTHGVMNNTAHAVMTTDMTGPHDGTTLSAASNGAAPVSATIAATAADGDNGHTMGDMVMLCIAMLAAAGALLLAALGLSRAPRIWAHRRTVPTGVDAGVTARLGTGPPPAWEFSVVRC